MENNKNNKNWKNEIDWTEKDNVLAKKYSLSREYIRQIRKSLGLSSSAELPRKNRYFKVNLENADWSLTSAEIAKQNNISVSSVSAQRKIWSPETVKKYELRDKLKNIDWSLKHKQIQDFLWSQYNIKTCQTNISRYKRVFAPELMQVKNRKELVEA